MWLKNPLSTLLNLIAPQSCVFCGTPSAGEEKSLCAGCYADLPWLDAASLPLPAPFEDVVVPLSYDFPVDAGIKALKFRRKLFYAPAFAEILCSSSPLLADDIDAILPVPLHWRRKAFRGFNQALEIAGPVAKFLGLPLMHGVRRTRATPFQSGLAAREREKNLRRAFSVNADSAYSHVLIIDDVVTTGSTTRSLLTSLKAHGVERVSLLAVARVR